LDRANIAPPQVPRKKAGKRLCELIEEWKEKIIPNRKEGGARASLSHIRTYIAPQLSETPLHELNLSTHQAFVTAVGRRTSRRKTVENVYGTLASILNKGRKWGYPVPDVRREDVEFPVDKTPQTPIFFFDADTAARIINASVQPFKLMFLIAALCGLRIGEVTALKVASLDFKRKQIHVLAALDYRTRKETTPKSENSAAPVYMPELLAKHLRDWLEKHYTPNPDGYLFINSKGRPYLSDNVVKYGVHRAIAKLGIQVPKGVHVGIHCFRHGVTSELLESGTPIHVVTRLMRHGDSQVTLNHYAHILGNAERVASERLSSKIEAQLESEGVDSISVSKTA
jgi:integrase